jgi:GNAT superfamily N-acetyltransferase
MPGYKFFCVQKRPSGLNGINALCEYSHHWVNVDIHFAVFSAHSKERHNEMSQNVKIATEQQRCFVVNASPLCSKTIKTPAGTLVLRNFCPPSLVESLRADNGLHAFARLPEREHQLLVDIAKRPDSALTLAYTLSGEIVGEVTLAPADAWWEGLGQTYEIAVQVSSRWRRLGIARQLLAFALELDALEEIIILAMGLSWHWDTERLGLTRYRYRQLIEQLFAGYGFSEYLTSEPNIRMDPANIFLARIGNQVNQQSMNHFLNRLLRSEGLPGI